MILKCCECNKEFEFTDGEIKFYKRKGFEVPKRCKECRKYSSGNSIGMKKNTFFSNAQLHGMPMNVGGGLSIVHAYIIEKVEDNQKKYLIVDKNQGYTFIEDITQATIISEESGKLIIEKLIGIEAKCEYKLLPKSYYERNV